MPRMEILVGPIASGKSTYARSKAAAGALVVCDDDIIIAVHGGDYGMYHETFKPLYCNIEAAIITHAAMIHRTVIIDTGGRTRSKRARFAALGRSLGFEVGVILFPWASASEHARRRMASDPRGMTYDDWLRVALAHERQFQPVDPVVEGLTVWTP